MAYVKALALASVAVLALTRASSAADLLPPPAYEPPPPPPIISELGGWYLRGDVGLGVNNTPNFSTSPSPLNFTGSDVATDDYFNKSLSESGLFDLGVGYQINNWFRVDVTGELRGGSTFQGLEVVNDSTTNNQFADFYRANMSSLLGMVNGYVDLGTWYGMTPYVGAGVGVAYNKFYGATDNGSNTVYYNGPAQPGITSSSGGIFGSNTSANLAWALMTGLDFNITQNLKLELGYRFLDYGKFKSGVSNCLSGAGSAGSFSGGNCTGGGYKLASHELTSNDFRIGLRWMIDTAAPPLEQAPLVRKY